MIGASHQILKTQPQDATGRSSNARESQRNSSGDLPFRVDFFFDKGDAMKDIVIYMNPKDFEHKIRLK